MSALVRVVVLVFFAAPAGPAADATIFCFLWRILVRIAPPHGLVKIFSAQVSFVYEINTLFLNIHPGSHPFRTYLHRQAQPLFLRQRFGFDRLVVTEVPATSGIQADEERELCSEFIHTHCQTQASGTGRSRDVWTPFGNGKEEHLVSVALR